MLENGLDYCTCSQKRCERHGKCAECIEYHTNKSKKYPQPYCKRERTDSVKMRQARRELREIAKKQKKDKKTEQ